MSQAASETTALRMVFEGAPDSLLSTIDQIESRMDSSEKKAIKSANNIESAFKRSMESRSNASRDAANLEQARVNAITSMMNDLGDEYVATEKKAVESTHKQVDAFGELGAAMDQRTEGMRRMAGAASAAVGIFTGMVGVVTTLVGLFALLGTRMLSSAKAAGEANEKYSDLHATIERMDDPKSGSAFARISDDVDRMHDAIGDANLSLERTEELWDRLQEQRENLFSDEQGRRFDESQRNEDLARSAANKSLREYARSLREAVPTSAEQEAFREYIKALEEIERISGGIDNQAALVFRKEAEEAAKALHESRLQHIADEEQARIDAEKDREFREIRAHQQRISRLNELERKRIESDARIISAAAQKLEQSFGGNDGTTRLLRTIVKKVDQSGRRAARNNTNP